MAEVEVDAEVRTGQRHVGVDVALERRHAARLLGGELLEVLGAEVGPRRDVAGVEVDGEHALAPGDDVDLGAPGQDLDAIDRVDQVDGLVVVVAVEAAERDGVGAAPARLERLDEARGLRGAGVRAAAAVVAAGEQPHVAVLQRPVDEQHRRPRRGARALRGARAVLQEHQARLRAGRALGRARGRAGRARGAGAGALVEEVEAVDELLVERAEVRAQRVLRVLVRVLPARLGGAQVVALGAVGLQALEQLDLAPRPGGRGDRADQAIAALRRARGRRIEVAGEGGRDRLRGIRIRRREGLGGAVAGQAVLGVGTAGEGRERGREEDPGDALRHGWLDRTGPRQSHATLSYMHADRRRCRQLDKVDDYRRVVTSVAPRVAGAGGPTALAVRREPLVSRARSCRRLRFAHPRRGADHPSYITSDRSTYLVPAITAQPSCSRRCWKINAVPVRGATWTPKSWNAVAPPVKPSLR